MKTFNDFKIIGIDHGYGNMKTANCCFQTGVTPWETEPIFTNDLLVWNNRYYTIGSDHKEFTADKFADDDYYILTLAAIARELRRARLTTAKVFIAAGLPLTWVTRQKQAFIEYLLQHKTVDYSFRKEDYHIEIVGADEAPVMEQITAEEMGCEGNVPTLPELQNGTFTPDSTLKSDEGPDS